MLDKTDEQIDLLGLIRIFWIDKWVICLFIIFFFLSGIIFTYLKVPLYESKIAFTVDTKPFDYKNQKVISDFKKMFHSPIVFNNWKKNNENSRIDYKKFGNTKLINGFLMSYNYEKKLIRFDKIKNKHFIIVSTNQLKIINDFFKYSNYVNDLLKSKYMKIVDETLEFNLLQLNKINKSGRTLYKNSNSNFNILMKDGYDVIFIEPPEMPKKISPRPFLIAAISLVIGSISGLLFVLFKNFLHKINLNNQTNRN